MKFAKTSLGLVSLCASLALLPFEAPSATPQDGSAREAGEEGTVATRIEELGGSDHEARGRAWESLLDRGSEVLRDLEKAAREAKDPEIRWNARLLSREIRRQEKPRRITGRPLTIPPVPSRGFDRDDPLLQEFDELRRRMGEFDDLHRRMEDLHRRLEEGFRNAPPGTINRQGSSVRVEEGDGGSVHVEVTETRDGEQETKSYDAESWEEFRKNYPEVVEKYGLDGSAKAFPFRFAPGGGAHSWWNITPFFSTPGP
ncbi:MAG: hypothetical protein ACREIU_04475, partial [Planctomycetota bacterium]